MKKKVFINGGIKTKYVVLNVEDLVGLDYHKPKSTKYKSYKELFGMKTERKALQLAKNIFTEMMAMVAEDMLNGDEYILPYHGLGMLKIMPMKGIGKADTDFLIKTKGLVYFPALVMSPDGYEKAPGIRVKLNRDLTIRLMDKILSKNHKFGI